ncbi:hypothetical protein G6F60_015081 [Rhizopus arrhizus]|nr:hypothetical protein G6F60_015081 [Rhizopus arrhizus]
MSMVDRVLHHGVVDQHDAHAFAVVQPQRLGAGERDAIERPGEFLHVAGQVQLDIAARFTPIRVLEQAAHRSIGQHLAAVVAQADTRVVQSGFGG